MSDDPLLRDLAPPDVPRGLREDALAAARTAFASPPRPDPWTRLLASRAARLAWAASVATLAVANAILPRIVRHGEAPIASTAARPDPELASIARLPRNDEHTLPALEGGRS